MLKICLNTATLVAALLFLLSDSLAQNTLVPSFDVPVSYNDLQLNNAWVGGLNSPQFSTFNANDDGWDDLLVFDRDGNNLMVFLNTASEVGESSYLYSKEYSDSFPALKNWVLLRDYNCDGKKDIFTNFQNSISVYTNTSVGDQLSFELAVQQLQCQVDFGNGFSTLPVVCLSIDMPSIMDYDNDGDMDIITWTETASTIYFFEGLGVDNGDCNSLDYEMTNRCYGMVAEGSEDNTLFIGDEYAEDTSPFDGNPDKCGFNVENPRILEGMERDGLHVGGSLLNIDFDQDGLMDLVVGDVSFNGLVALPMLDALDQQDSATAVLMDFPTNLGTDVPVDLQKFPAGYYEDVNNDGVKDLIVAPNSTIELNDDEGVWLYLNEGENDLPSFNFQQTKWLQEQMVDLGRGAHPVLVDIDGDGLKDLIVSNDEYYQGLGLKPSLLAYYKNVGDAENPSFELIDLNFETIDLYQLENIHPAFGDVDGDGDLDMMLGEEQGFIHFFENVAGAGNFMDLELAQPAMADVSGESIDIGQYATPQLIDVNGDGLLDMLVGEKNGVLNLFLNTGSAAEFEWTLFENDFDNKWGNVLANNLLGINGFSIPYLFETEEDGFQLLLANELGESQLYGNISGNLEGEFTLLEDVFFGIKHNKRAAVWFEDINNDGYRDLIQGNNAGGLHLYFGDFIDAVEETMIAKEDVLVYPNPSSGDVRIEFAVPMNGQLSLLDASGRKVMETPLHFQRQIDLQTELSEGMYFIIYQSGHIQQHLGRLVIQH